MTLFISARTEERSAMLVGKDCPGCKSPGPIYYATRQQASDFASRRKNLQEIMPEVSADDRERFITGYCAPCWDNLFSEVK